MFNTMPNKLYFPILFAGMFLFDSSALADFVTGMRAYQKGEWEVAFRELEPLANKGDPEAQYSVATLYVQGLGVSQDRERADVLFRNAEKQLRVLATEGNANAQFYLGSMYNNGFGVEKDEARAFDWFSKAAEQGHATAAQHVAGVYQSRGHSLATEAMDNYEKASQWYLLAAEKGDIFSQHLIGLNYLHGRGVQQDQVQAYKWFVIIDRRLKDVLGANEEAFRHLFAPELVIESLNESMSEEELRGGEALATEWLQQWDAKEPE